MKNSITKLASIAFLGGLFGRGLRYAVNVVIARGLGPEALGLFAFGMVVMKASGVVARLGLDRAVQKYVPIYRRQNDASRVTGTIVLAVGLSTVAGIGFSLLIYALRADIDRLSEVGFDGSVQLFVLGIPLFSAMMVAIAATRGFKETRFEVYTRDVGQSSVAIVLVALGAYVIDSFRFVVAGYLFSLLVGTLLAVGFLLDRDNLRWRPRPTFETREILTFSLPLTFAAVSLYLISWTDILMLGVFVDPAKVGWYQAAYQTSVLLAIVLQAGNSIFPAVAADLYHDGQRERLGRVYTSVTKWIAYLTVLGYAFLAVFAGDILGIFGTATPAAILALLVLGLGQVASTITGPIGFLLTMSDHERVQTLNAILVCVVNVALNFVLIGEFGIVGAALATSISFGLINLVRLFEAWYLLGIQPYSRSYWKGAVAIGATLPIMVLGHGLAIPTVVRVMLVGVVSLGAFAVAVRVLGFDETDRTLLESLD